MKFHVHLSQILQYNLHLQGTLGFNGSFDPSGLSKGDFLYLRLVAMSSRHHPLAGDEGSATEVVSSVQRHLVGNRVSGTLISSDNLIILRRSNWSSMWGMIWQMENLEILNHCHEWKNTQVHMVLKQVHFKLFIKTGDKNIIWLVSYTLLQAEPGIPGPSWWLSSECKGKSTL